jgi:hypothetical protein
MKTQYVSSLSVRAGNAICDILVGATDLTRAAAVKDVLALTRRGLRLRLHAVAYPQRKSIRQLLSTQRNCGAATVREIMTWMDGKRVGVKPHVCTCRHCGRMMPSEPAK